MNSNFQSRSSKEGQQAQEIAKQIVTGSGFKITNTNKRLKEGVTSNIIALDKNDKKWYFDVIGSFTSSRDGLLRTDSVWKVLGRCCVLSKNDVGPIVILTTNLPSQNSVGYLALHSAQPTTFYDAIEMMTPSGKMRLRSYASGFAKEPLPGFWHTNEIYKSLIFPDTQYGSSISFSLPETYKMMLQNLGFHISAELEYSTKVVIPSKYKSGSKILESERIGIVDRIKGILSKVGGGCTSGTANGHWIEPSGGIVDEDVIYIETFSDNKISPDIVKEIVRILINEMQQSAAAIIIDGKMYQFTSP